MKLLSMTPEFPDIRWLFRRAWEFIGEKRYPYWQRWYWTRAHGMRLVSETVAVTVHDCPFRKVTPRYLW